MSCIVFDEVKHCKSFITVHLLPVSARFGHSAEEFCCAIAVMGRDQETSEHAANIRSGFGRADQYILSYLYMGASEILAPS